MSNTTTRTLTALAIVGAFGLGVWSSPYLTAPSPATDQARVDVMLPADAPTPVRGAETRPAAARITLAADAPLVRDHAQTLLNQGSDVNKAVEGFTSAEQFLSVVHASRHTGVPFMLLKHRVLNERLALADAIAASRPDLNVSRESERARLLARAELLGLSGAAGL